MLEQGFKWRFKDFSGKHVWKFDRKLPEHEDKQASQNSPEAPPEKSIRSKTIKRHFVCPR